MERLDKIKLSGNETEKKDKWEQFENIETPEDLLSFMTDNISYGFVGRDNGKIYSSRNESEMDVDFRKEYYLQSPKELLASGHGLCWDQVELERNWFSRNKQDYDFKTLMMFDKDDLEEGINQHTFLAFEKDGKWHWLEHSFQGNRGIHEYGELEDLILDVVKKTNEADHKQDKETMVENLKNIKVCEYELPDFGIGPIEFVERIIKKNDPDLMTRKQ